jgi:hypothetical protein
MIPGLASMGHVTVRANAASLFCLVGGGGGEENDESICPAAPTYFVFYWHSLSLKNEIHVQLPHRVSVA